MIYKLSDGLSIINNIYDGELNNEMLLEVLKINAIRQKKGVINLFRDCNVDLLELNSSESFLIPLAGFLRSRSQGKI